MPITACRWHRTRLADESVIWTRHEPPCGWNERTRPINTDEVMALSDVQHRRLRAAHEAGHVVAGLLNRIPIVETDIEQRAGSGGRTRSAEHFRVEWFDYVVFVAAGERAGDAWLRGAGLHTPARGWVNEVVGAGLDRRHLDEYGSQHQPRLRVAYNDAANGTTVIAYADACDTADRLLTDNWRRVQALTDALYVEGQLDAARIAQITQLPPNPV